MKKNQILTFIRSDLQYYIFLIVAFFLPLTKKYLPILMSLWVLSGIISIRKVELRIYKPLIFLLFPFLFYLVHIIGLIYSDNLKEGLSDLEIKLSFLLVSLVILFITEKVKSNYRLILKFFVFGNLIASIICLISAFHNSMEVNEMGNFIFEISVWPEVTSNLSLFELINQRLCYFSYNYLSLIHHSSYFSMYLVFSIVIIVYLIRSSRKSHLTYYFLIFYFSIFIWLLGSRAAYLTYLICLFSFCIIVILKYRKYWIGFFILILGITIMSLILSNKRIRNNINETANLIYSNEYLNENSDIRLWLWKLGIEVFEDNYLIGVGTGDIDDVMKNKYLEYNLTEAYERNLNAHNQYIDTAVKLGVFGLMILLIWLSYILVIAIRRKQFLMFFFGLIILINFFFEAMLDTIAGISFVVFFYSLLYAIYYKEDY